MKILKNTKHFCYVLLTLLIIGAILPGELDVARKIVSITIGYTIGTYLVEMIIENLKKHKK